MKVAISQLTVTKENPRTTKASLASHQALMASMSTHGLIQPIVVRPNGSADSYEVIAGSRRLAAAKELGWTEVEVVENDAEYGVGELGAAENMMREPMHPLDECAVISRLVADGETMEAVAGRFGQTERWVEQRIKLTALAPEVQKCFRNGLITMAAAQAFTLGDKKDQKDYLLAAKDWQLEAANVQRHFQNKSIPAKYALFALDKYPKGAILSDLFGEDVWLTDKAAFHQLQKEAIEKLKVELVDVEGWAEAVVLMTGPDSRITGRYVKVEGRILKADRSKHSAIVTYHPGSGSCSVERGYVLRKDVAKVKQGAKPEDDTAEVEDIVSLTADSLSSTQLQIVGALQTNAIELAIAEGDVRLALIALAGGLLSWNRTDSPPWTGAIPRNPDYKGVNGMLTEQLEAFDDQDATYRIPTREALGEMTVNDLAPLLCNLALRSILLMHAPNAQATKELKSANIQWMGFDEGFLKRYRTDALENLADRLKLKRENLMKGELVKMIVGATKDLDVDRIIDFDEAIKSPSKS